jgi:hypothetical protein
MGFLTTVLKPTANAAKKAAKYEQLGYLENPFPPRGQVRPEIYVDRPELENLQQGLLTFLTGNGPGAFWAIEAERGIGKSNFLQHLDRELKEAVQNGQLADTVHQYIPSPHIEPRLLVRYMLQAIGEERFSLLLRDPPALPDSSKGTELYRFFDSFKQWKPTTKLKQPELFVSDDQKQPDTEDTLFLMRWLGGHQVYVDERKKYNLWTEERMPPAVAFPYLRILVNGMESKGILKRIVLLLDEFEDVQTLKIQPQSEYIQALKSLLNSFNWRGLFIIIAGQSASFTTLGSRYPSLSDRWQRVKLEPVQSSAQAVKLARAYMDFGREEYKRRKPSSKKKTELSPSEVEIKAIYADVKKPVMTQQEVTQRDLLDKLHEWLEEKTN